MNLFPVRKSDDAGTPDLKGIKGQSLTLPTTPFGEVIGQLHPRAGGITKPDQVEVPVFDETIELSEAIASEAAVIPTEQKLPAGQEPATSKNPNINQLTIQPTPEQEAIAASPAIVKPGNLVPPKNVEAPQLVHYQNVTEIENAKQSPVTLLTTIKTETTPGFTQSIINGALPTMGIKVSIPQSELKGLTHIEIPKQGATVDGTKVSKVGVSSAKSAVTGSPEISSPNLSSGHQPVSPGDQKSPEHHPSVAAPGAGLRKSPEFGEMGTVSFPTRQANKAENPVSTAPATKSVPGKTGRTPASIEVLTRALKTELPTTKPINAAQVNDVVSRLVDTGKSMPDKRTTPMSQPLKTESRQSDQLLYSRATPLPKTKPDVRLPAPAISATRQVFEQSSSIPKEAAQNKIAPPPVPLMDAVMKAEMTTSPVAMNRVAATTVRPVQEVPELNRKKHASALAVSSNESQKTTTGKSDSGENTLSGPRTEKFQPQQVIHHESPTPKRPDQEPALIPGEKSVAADTKPADSKPVRNVEPSQVNQFHSTGPAGPVTPKTSGVDNSPFSGWIDKATSPVSTTNISLREPDTILPQMIHRVLSLLGGRVRQHPGMQQMQVKTASWGTLNIQLNHDVADRKVTILVETESAKDAVRSSLTAIQANLERKGIIVQNIDVRLPGENTADKQSQTTQDQNFHKNPGAHTGSGGGHRTGNAPGLGKPSGPIHRENSPAGQSRRDFGYNTMEIVA